MTTCQTGRLLHRVGLALSWWGLDSLAILAWRAALRRDASLLEARFVLGEALLRGRAWRDASEALREVVLRAPAHAEAWGNLTLACARQGAVERAVSALERLAAVGPHGPEPLLLAAALLKKQRRPGAAIAIFRRAAGVGPSPRTVRFFLGEEILGRREWDALVAGHLELHGSAAALPVVASTAPEPAARTNRPGRRSLASSAASRPILRLWRRVGMWLIERYHLANGRTQLLLGRLLSSQRRPHEAIRAFHQASLIRQQRLGVSLAWATGPLDLSAGRGAERVAYPPEVGPLMLAWPARLLVPVLLAAAPQPSPEGLEARRQAYICTSAPRGPALVACRRALELGLNAPHAATVNLVLGLHLAALGRWDEVVTVYRERVRLAPQSADAYWRLGDALLLGLAQPEQALPSLREAVRLDPRLSDAYISLALALNATGAQGESLAAFEEAVRLDPRILENRPVAQRVREAARNGRRLAP